ncbi:Uncharacterized protein HZ326_26124 [Fusarium oxysporum f. sp. albedinis]|nr:Uncharacterized protein HZ326_26124 [Fusarium oxysporum f. sp. albedinis]
MAVHPAMPGLSVTISIDDRAAPESGSASESSDIYRCYINCRSGAKYFIDVSLGIEVADDHTIKADKKRIRSMGSIDLRISRAQARGRVRFSIPSGRRQATSRAVVGSQALNIAGKALARSERNLTHGTCMSETFLII